MPLTHAFASFAGTMTMIGLGRDEIGARLTAYVLRDLSVDEIGPCLQSQSDGPHPIERLTRLEGSGLRNTFECGVVGDGPEVGRVVVYGSPRRVRRLVGADVVVRRRAVDGERREDRYRERGREQRAHCSSPRMLCAQGCSLAGEP